jgi:L-fucose mutarotase/ribose pyranase (RbsD/FucU family)
MDQKYKINKMNRKDYLKRARQAAAILKTMRLKLYTVTIAEFSVAIYSCVFLTNNCTYLYHARTSKVNH